MSRNITQPQTDCGRFTQISTQNDKNTICSDMLLQFFEVFRRNQKKEKVEFETVRAELHHPIYINVLGVSFDYFFFLRVLFFFFY